MKKIVTILLIACLACGFIAAQESAYKGIMPSVVQAAFYTPTYQCIYLKSADEVGSSIEAGKWITYSTKIDKNAVTYDGMAGKRSGYNVIRLKANTKKSSQEVVIYIDNIKLTDGAGKTVFTLDFENGDPAGVYQSQGRKLEKNGEVVTFDGKKAFLMHAKSQNLYGHNGIEYQWTLPESATADKMWDFGKEDYTVSFDFFIASAE